MTEEFVDFIHILCEAAAAEINPYFMRVQGSVELKGRADFVTPADRNAEKKIRELINLQYPHHGIIGEEFGNEREGAEYVWVLDPIDGTSAFVHGIPTFVTQIALLQNRKPILGAVYQPTLRFMCYGDGNRTLLNGRTVKMRQCDFENGSLLYGTLKGIHRYGRRESFEKLFSKMATARSGCDGYGALLLAGGYVDIMVEAKMAFWDTAPLIPIIEGAGGIVTDWDGGDALTSDSFVASHADVHALVLKTLKC